MVCTVSSGTHQVPLFYTGPISHKKPNLAFGPYYREIPNTVFKGFITFLSAPNSLVFHAEFGKSQPRHIKC